MIPRAIALIAMLVLLGTTNAKAQTEFLPEQPELTVDLVPEDALAKGTYVQAQLNLTLRLHGRYAYEALTITLPEIPNAEIITTQRPRTRYLVSYGGAGHVYEAGYAIIPQRSGVLEIPPIRIVGRVKTDNGEDLNFDLANDGFAVQVDPAVEGFSSEKWFVADAAEIADSWSQSFDDIRVGDVIRREVHIKARGTTGDRMPALATPRATGATLVEVGRATETEITGNGTIGHLWQNWDIRIDRDTFAEIAPVRLPYWNATSHSEEIVSLPVTRIEPLPANTAAIAADIMDEVRAEHALQKMLWLELMLVLAAPLILGILWCLYAMLPTRSDLTLQRRIERATHPKEQLAAIGDWAIAQKLVSAANPIGELARQATPEFEKSLSDLNRTAFSETAQPFGTSTLAKQCRSHARSHRFSQLRQTLRRSARTIFGPKNSLTST